MGWVRPPKLPGAVEGLPIATRLEDRLGRVRSKNRLTLGSERAEENHPLPLSRHSVAGSYTLVAKQKVQIARISGRTARGEAKDETTAQVPASHIR